MPGAEAWQAFAGVAAVVILLASLAVALKRLGIVGRQPDPAVGALTTRVTALEKQAASQEATLAALPSAREFAKLDRCVSETQGDVKAVKASVDGQGKMLEGLASQVGAINKHLLGAGG